MKLLRTILSSWALDILLAVGAIGAGLILYNYDAWGPTYIEPFFVYLGETALQIVSYSAETINWARENFNFSSLLIVLGITLSVGLVAWRILWRLRTIKRFTSTDCPKCEYPLSRVKRTPLEKKISKILPLRRFYCKRCRWSGIRVKPSSATSDSVEKPKLHHRKAQMDHPIDKLDEETLYVPKKSD